jgi:hypothetical protein
VEPEVSFAVRVCKGGILMANGAALRLQADLKAISQEPPEAGESRQAGESQGSLHPGRGISGRGAPQPVTRFVNQSHPAGVGVVCPSRQRRPQHSAAVLPGGRANRQTDTSTTQTGRRPLTECPERGACGMVGRATDRRTDSPKHQQGRQSGRKQNRSRYRWIGAGRQTDG